MEEPKVEKPDPLIDLIVGGMISGAAGVILMRLAMIAWTFYR